MLTAHELTKRFGTKVAADAVSFDVPAGHIVGFIGANGAGKTTTMRLLMGLLDPDAGEARWEGRPLTAADRAGFGYMPEERGLYPKQKVADQLAYLGELHHMSPSEARQAARQLLEQFGLTERSGAKLEELSLGNQQRVQVAAALIHRPTALILDEPFSGLDPAAVASMSDALRLKAAEGIPVLFSSHQLDLIERLCDALVVLDQGKVILSGTADAIRDAHIKKYRLQAMPDTGWLRDMRGVDVIDIEGATATFTLADDTLRSAIAAEAVRRGELVELSPLQPTLNEIYQEATR